MASKLHDNDKTRVTDLMRKLSDHGIKTWVKLNPNSQADCQWRFIDSPHPNCFGTMDQPLNRGGVGALIIDLKEACFNHGIMKRAPHISSRSHVRLAVNGTPVWTTSNGG